MAEDTTWTVVVHKRRARQPAPPSLPPPGPSVRGTQALLPCSSHTPLKETASWSGSPEETAEAEKLILSKLSRSMERVQKSEFFERFLEQLQIPSFMGVAHVLSHTSHSNKEGNMDLAVSMEKTATEVVVTKDPYCTGQEGLGKPPSKAEEVVVEDNNTCTSLTGPEVVVEDNNSSTSSKGGDSEGLDKSSPSLDCEGERQKRPTSFLSSKGLNEKGSSLLSSEGEGERSSSNGDGKLWPQNGGVVVQGSHMDKESKVQIVVYGVGSIAESEISRCQFALVLLLKQMFSWVECVEVYDPVLSPSECRVMEAMGCLTIAINEEGRRTICMPTIFYMPHCEDWLYNNVLEANWMPQKLNQLVVLGNSFRSYREAWSSFQVSRLKAPPTYVLEFHELAKEIPLEATSSFQLPAFNNISWHFISAT